MTQYCVRYRLPNGEMRVERFDAALLRALFIVSAVAMLIEIRDQWEEAGDAGGT